MFDQNGKLSTKGKIIAIVAGLIMGSLIYKSQAYAQEKQCSRYCNPEVSTPCGKSCIPKGNMCRKSWTTACVGIREDIAPRGYSPKEVKHVNKAPGATD